MKTWTIPIEWKVCGAIQIEAHSLEQAIKIANTLDRNSILPKNPTLIVGSCKTIDIQQEEIRKIYNCGQEDK